MTETAPLSSPSDAGSCVGRRSATQTPEMQKPPVGGFAPSRLSNWGDMPDSIASQSVAPNNGGQMTEQRYFAGGQEFLYPHAGDPPAPLDTKVLLLSKGGICTTGYWNATWCLGWLPLPKRNTEKEDKK